MAGGATAKLAMKEASTLATMTGVLSIGTRNCFRADKTSRALQLRAQARRYPLG